MAHKDKRFNPNVADMARQKWGEFIKMRRNDLGLSPTELAEMMGVHRQRVHELESGNTNYAINTFIAALGCLRCEVFIETKDIDNDVPGMGTVSKN